jgi:hypothetical protein
VLIFQYDDKISRVTINYDNDDLEKEDLCNSDEMTRLIMQRGSNNKVYYAKTKGYSGILMEIEHHRSQVHEIVETEVFRLPGEKILAFQLDTENIVDSGDENATQAVFLMTDRQRIYYIKHDEGMNFQIERIIDLQRFELTEALDTLERNVWSKCYITQRLLTMHGKIYNLETETIEKFETPMKYFFENKT